MIARRGFFAALFGAPALVIAKPVIASNVHADPWGRAISSYIRFHGAGVTIEQVAENALNLQSPMQVDRNRIITILRAAGWQRFRVALDGPRRCEYRPLGGTGGFLNETR